MFAYYCIIIAALFAGNSVKEYRFIALAVFAEFLLHKLAYNHLFLDFRSENKGFIFYMYAMIQAPIAYYLYKVKSHFVITFLIIMNFLYNLAIPLSFNAVEFEFIYYAKNPIIRTIMVMELIYIGLLSQYVRDYLMQQGITNDNDYLDRLFCVRGWNFKGSVL